MLQAWAAQLVPWHIDEVADGDNGVRVAATAGTRADAGMRPEGAAGVGGAAGGGVGTPGDAVLVACTPLLQVEGRDTIWTSIQQQLS